MADVAGRLAALRDRRDPQAWRRCGEVRRLVVVCASSRGGSSAFGELLRAVPGVVSTSAEINPHVVVPTLPRPTADLVADPSPAAGAGEGLRVLRHELGLDLGRPADGPPDGDHVAWRLTMQWPTAAIDPDTVGTWLRDAVAEEGPGAPREALLLGVLARARRAHGTIEPRAYDLEPALVARRFPGAPVPAGPPPEPVVEMRPFVVPRAWRAVPDATLRTHPVALTTPRNAFRLPLLQRAFPAAEIRVVHLVRNPAAAVNGLLDGWHHHGFFSTPVDVPLGIAGWTDRYPWGARWWCYDLPPGWRERTTASLPEVCAFQWAASHRSTLEEAARLGLPVHRVRFEDVVASEGSRRRVLARLAAFVGVDVEAAVAAGEARLPVVMPTAPPRPGRWRRRAHKLADVLTDGPLRALADELGYGRDTAAWM